MGNVQIKSFLYFCGKYEALHFSDTGIPVLRTGCVKRRYREFVNLMLRLEDNSAYKKLLKGL